MGQKLSVYARGSSLRYKWDDDVYVEDGKGAGFGGGVRFFPQGGKKGFYVGGGLSYSRSKWDWTDGGGATSGKGETNSLQLGAEVGYRFNLGSERVSLTPAINHKGHQSIDIDSVPRIGERL